MTVTARLDHFAVVLNEPQIPENIGAAARAMKNMGLRRLIVVAPKSFDLKRILMLATLSAADVVDGIELFSTLPEALKTFGYVVGATARAGKQRVMAAPGTIVPELINISQENSVALVFGREDCGLSNEDLRYCHSLVHIPTAEFSSLNLAQAVMVMCYELYTGQLPAKKAFAPRLASRHELDTMFEQLREILVRISYINPENPDYWMNHLRNFFTRIGFRAREVSIIRGLIRQVNWYGEKRYQDGLRERAQKKETEKDSCD